MTGSSGATAALRPMVARDTSEPHRASTPLELLFDLVSVIAIAAAAAGLHHAIADGHVAQGIARFCAAFFGIWWAWMNYTWFASAYDNDDALFRLLTLVIMAGSLAMAAGIRLFFESADLSLVVIGYVVMRFGMVALWLRAARHDPARRQTNLAYAAGIGLVQLYWIALVVYPPPPHALFYALFALGAILELCVPAVAERRVSTPWHRHHIIERYGLLNIIVLGETLLAGATALENVAAAHFDIALLHIALSLMVILFSMWWLYFAREEQLSSTRLSHALAWGYGHIVIFMSGAATGAGFAVLVDIATGHAHVSRLAGDYAVAIPVALYFLGLWLVRDRTALSGKVRHILPAFSLLIVLAPPLFGLEGIAALAVIAVVARSAVTRRRDRNAISMHH